VAVPSSKIGLLLIGLGFVIGCELNTSLGQTMVAGATSELRSVRIPDEKGSSHAGEKIDSVLTRIALDSLPAKYEDVKDWGEQAKRWDGIKWSREGWKIESSRRWKMVNHGTWQKYSATMRNPEEEFSLQIKNMHETEEEKIAFEIHLAAHLNIDARQSKWVKGVQLYSVNAQGHAKVRLQVAIEMDVRMGISNFPPDIIMIPRATTARLQFDEFRIDRISKVGGEVAQQITKHARSKLDEKIEEQEQKIVAKINKQLEKKQDEFRLSISDAMKSRWTQPLSGILPGLNATTDR
jgi:hypothetical protein